MVDGRVHDNAMEPREWSGITAKRARVTQCSHEGVLHNVFGLIADVSCGDRAQLFARALVKVRQGASHDGFSTCWTDRSSVLSRPLGAVDHEYADGAFRGLELDAELLLQDGEERRSQCVRRASRSGLRIELVFEGDVVAAG